jgi:hypothetical protein
MFQLLDDFLFFRVQWSRKHWSGIDIFNFTSLATFSLVKPDVRISRLAFYVASSLVDFELFLLIKISTFIY